MSDDALFGTHIREAMRLFAADSGNLSAPTNEQLGINAADAARSVTPEPCPCWDDLPCVKHDQPMDESMAEFVERHIASLTWSPETSDDARTLVAGNLRHFAYSVSRDFPARSVRPEPSDGLWPGSLESLSDLSSDTLRDVRRNIETILSAREAMRTPTGLQSSSEETR